MILEPNKLKNVIPYIGSLLILIGFVKMSIYYNHFNININNYVELSEILISFIPDIIKYSSIIFIVFLYSFLLDTEEDNQKSYDTNNEIIEMDKFFPRIGKILKRNITAILLLLLMIAFTIISAIWNEKNYLLFYRFSWMIFIILFFNIMLMEFRRKYKIINGNYFDSTYNNLLIISFLFTAYIIQSTYSEIEEVENHNGPIVCFHSSKKLIQSEENLIYIGQTKNYFFMYNLKDKETYVYTRNEISNLVIRKKNQKTTANSGLAQ